MPRLIDAEKLLKTIMSLESWNVPDFVYESINNAPTVDAVPTDFHDKCMQIEIQKRFGMEEVVRCKDCKHYKEFEGEMECWARPMMFPREPNDFCSMGERREDADNQ